MHHKKYLQRQRRIKMNGQTPLRMGGGWLLATKKTGKNRGCWLPLKRRLNSRIEAGACWVLCARVFAALGGGEGAMYLGPFRRRGLDISNHPGEPRFVILTILDVRLGGIFIASQNMMPSTNLIQPEYCLCLTPDSVCVEIASYDLLRCGYRLPIRGKVT